jgi:hypothetical protein
MSTPQDPSTLYGDSVGESTGAVGILTEQTGHGSGPLDGVGGPRSPSGPVSQGTVFVDGVLPPEVVIRHVRRRFVDFGTCFRTAQKTQPDLTGAMAVEFAISKEGTVTSATAVSSALPLPEILDSTMRSCVLTNARSLEFPRAESSTKVIYRLLFRKSTPP